MGFFLMKRMQKLVQSFFKLKIIRTMTQMQFMFLLLLVLLMIFIGHKKKIDSLNKIRYNINIKLNILAISTRRVTAETVQRLYPVNEGGGEEPRWRRARDGVATIQNLPGQNDMTRPGTKPLKAKTIQLLTFCKSTIQRQVLCSHIRLAVLSN